MTKKLSLIFVFLTLITLFACNEESEDFLSTLEETVVTRVVDGDTIVIESGEKVRMILINSPESVHRDKEKNTPFGKKASEYTEEKLLDQTIYMEKDVSDTDRYGRLLRYIYLEDGTFYNEMMVKDGYAQLSTFPPDVKHQEIIQAAEKHARENNLGLWEEVTEEVLTTGLYVGSTKSDKYHDLDCYHVESIEEDNLIYFKDKEDAENKGYVPCKKCQDKE